MWKGIGEKGLSRGWGAYNGLGADSQLTGGLALEAQRVSELTSGDD